ncbi:uncharacterized protein KY384_002809 [Bacidia gigantensis]|uniref:uncharacterized protein n=1 Tax=Bacidia gigantensis TaxID=2732470 RepID=UPI001D04EE96|nr:uncharacterized protein KY384_002809 [Bacidia gigantensis]KAG8532931.1 hypothetical protein KY384_002809 [Bacidia gigantensis]
MSASEWRRTLDINTTGSFLCAQAAAKTMIAQKTGGSIVFIASISAQKTNFPQPQAAYNASKAALVSLKRSLAAEWAVHGIRVNSLSPGVGGGEGGVEGTVSDGEDGESGGVGGAVGAAL